MTFSEAIGWAGLGVAGLASFIGLFFWTMNVWFDGDWWEKAVSALAWVVVLAGVIYAFSQVAVPA